MEKLTAFYEHTQDGWWVVSVPEISGAHSQGRTLLEAREMIKDATRLLLEALARESYLRWYILLSQDATRGRLRMGQGQRREASCQARSRPV